LSYSITSVASSPFSSLDALRNLFQALQELPVRKAGHHLRDVIGALVIQTTRVCSSGRTVTPLIGRCGLFLSLVSSLQRRRNLLRISNNVEPIENCGAVLLVT